MKILLGCVLVVLLCAPVAPFAHSQSASQSNPPLSQQWVSHQMNQPPPDPNERCRVSDEVVNEIRELYALAQKELEAKKQNKQKDSN